MATLQPKKAFISCTIVSYHFFYSIIIEFSSLKPWNILITFSNQNVPKHIDPEQGKETLQAYGMVKTKLSSCKTSRISSPGSRNIQVYNCHQTFAMPTTMLSPILAWGIWALHCSIFYTMYMFTLVTVGIGVRLFTSFLLKITFFTITRLI